MQKNKIKILALLAAVAFVSAFSAVVTTVYSVARVTPFSVSADAFVPLTGRQLGGVVNTFIAADTLRYGDVVFLATFDTVKKSSTLANYNTLAGVVVGGATRLGGVLYAASDSGTISAIAGQTVYVLRRGRAYVTNDANGTIAAGGFVIPSDATAGAVETKTTAIDTNYRTLGKAVIGASASKFMLIDVNVK
jgi:hypothetical protein